MSTEISDGGCLARVRAARPEGSALARTIGAFILEDPARTKGLSVTALAKGCGVSQATVSRFCASLGYASFKAFQLDLATSIAQNGVARLDALVSGESTAATISRVFEGNRQTLLETEIIIDPKTMKSVAQCVNKAGRIYVLGLGGSGLIARYTAQRFMSLGLHATAIDDPYDQLFATAGANKCDVVFGISHSGRTAGIVEGLSAAKQHGSRTVALTNYESSPLARICDFKLITAFRENKLSPSFSTSHVAQMSVMDTLYFLIAGQRMKAAEKLAKEVDERTISIQKRR